jgi:hypothetical protein
VQRLANCENEYKGRGMGVAFWMAVTSALLRSDVRRSDLMFDFKLSVIRFDAPSLFSPCSTHVRIT